MSTLEAKALLCPSLRSLRSRTLSSSLSLGTPVRPDTVSVVLAAKADRFLEPVEVWLEETVRELLWVDVLAWCEHHDLELPLDVPEALWAVLRVLEADGLLGGDSDRIDTLRRPLLEFGGLGRDGQRRHPSRRVS